MADQNDPEVFNAANYQLRNRVSAPEQFADGVSLMFLGYPVTKMFLHTISEPRNGENPEIRKAVQCLTMPTVAAIELADFILTTAKKAEAKLLADLNPKGQQRVRDVLERFQLVETHEVEPADLSVSPNRTSRQGRVRPKAAK